MTIDSEYILSESPQQILNRIKYSGVITLITEYQTEELVPNRYWGCVATIIKTIDPIRVGTHTIPAASGILGA